ncbi:hypothetical protein HW555_006450 [Spodoptera exigua]|uniref:Nuclease HARBI1 n=1 Tax=Spodoptera exigua TaxID=7107 RepID=A0A835GGG1_SPOEX|nr:hypothetical protein HW555_006450 [Spodoptera exigua]
MFDGSFINFLRMSKSDFEYLLQNVGPFIEKQDTNLRSAVTAETRLAITLRYLATGDSYSSLSYTFRVSKQLISRIIPEVCKNIIRVLKNYIQVRKTKRNKQSRALYTPPMTFDFEDSDHNVIEGAWRREYTVEGTSILELERRPSNSARTATIIRDQFGEYFMSERGSLPWQNNSFVEQSHNIRFFSNSSINLKTVSSSHTTAMFINKCLDASTLACTCCATDLLLCSPSQPELTDGAVSLAEKVEDGPGLLESLSDELLELLELDDDELESDEELEEEEEDNLLGITRGRDISLTALPVPDRWHSKYFNTCKYFCLVPGRRTLKQPLVLKPGMVYSFLRLKRVFTLFIFLLASMAAISFLIGGAFGNGLTDSGEKTLEVVARGVQALDVEATGSLALFIGKD